MNYVFTASENQVATICEYYQDFLVPSDQDHIRFLFRSPNLTVTLYRSLKVMLQGKDAKDEYLMWAEMLGFSPEVAETTSNENTVIQNVPVGYAKVASIGSDEVGTGDFFGPVIVTAAYVPLEKISYVLDLGVKDSKKLTDEFIDKIGSDLMKNIDHVVLVTKNEKYNELVTRAFNMNKIKAYLHNHAIRKLLAKNPGKYDMVVIDKFCSVENYFEYLSGVESFKGVTLIEKAEDKYLSVAAASIISRYVFLREMADLSDKTGIVLPFGAGPAVDLIGKRIALEKGFEIFNSIAKTNFKNLDKIKGMM
ncbi:MAG: ribonuclease HIII [Bacilli bacterium]|nr:ribonuclease HIII [Bacilli bacterium]